MSSARRYFLPLRFTEAALASVAFLAVSSSTALAAYGPPPPPPGQPVPGGYNCVITSRLDPAFEKVIIGPLRVGDLIVLLQIPAYTFPGPVQVTITEPFSANGACQGGATGNFGFKGYHLLGGVGILIGLRNAAYGTFPHPVRLRINEIELHNLQALELASVSGNHARGIGNRRTHGPFTIRIRHSAEFIMLDKLRHPHAAAVARHSRPSTQFPVSELLTASLLPATAPVPGLGVLALTAGGSALTSGGTAALGR
jgi:hypothetical protein